MSKKLVCLISLILVLSLAGNALAGIAYFRPSDDPCRIDNLWTTAANWITWNSAVLPPDSATTAYLNKPGGELTLIDSTCAAAGGPEVGIAHWNSGDHDLLMTGGTFDVTGLVAIGSGVGNNGLMTMGGGAMTVGLSFYVGGTGNVTWSVNGGNGTLEMTGGTVDITGNLEVGTQWGYGHGDVAVRGGTITASDLVIDLGAVAVHSTGKIITDGDDSAALNAYVAAGKLLGTVFYNTATSKTEVTAVPEPATIALLGLGGLLLRKRK